MNDPFLHNTQALPVEEEYIKKAIQSGVQSTEILNCVVMARLGMYSLRNLVSAMENAEHMVYPIEPMDVQKCYTIVKTIIKRVHTKISMIPDTREDNNKPS